MPIVFLLVMALAGAQCLPLAKTTRDERLSHLRTGVDRIAEVIDSGYERSRTFKNLVDHLRSAGAIVFIEAGRCKPNALNAVSGCLAPRAQTENARYFQMVVDVEQPDDRLIALVGHELQHAFELVNLPMTTKNAIEAFASTFEHAGTRTYETEQARRVTQVILRELRAAGRGQPERKVERRDRQLVDPWPWALHNSNPR